MLTNLTDILEQAERDNYGVIAPDFVNLYGAKCMLETAEELQAPLILSYSSSFKPVMDVRSYARFIKILIQEIEQYSTQVCLHLDHAASLAEIQEAVDVGFTSVMIDASTAPLEDNIALSRKVVELAGPVGVSVEAELGHVTTGEGYIKTGAGDELLTDPDQAGEFVERTGIDALAVAIGNVHGAYIGDPDLDFTRLEKIRSAVDVPIVLHGSSGIGMDELGQAITGGIRKINLYSELITSIFQHTRTVLSETLTDPLRVYRSQTEAINAVLSRYILASGSAGRSA